MSALHSYPSIYNVGHKAVEHLFAEAVYVQEKVDGSQFSFGINDLGNLECRSKGASINMELPEKMFTEAVQTVKELAPLLIPGWTYRGEYLKKPKHNALMYSRVPLKHIVLFDINTGHEFYLPYEGVKREAERLGLEVVPLIHTGVVSDLTLFRSFLERESFLGGQKIEGVVIKPILYNLFGKDKKCIMAKFVSEAFKEVHSREWGAANPGANDILQSLIISLKSLARWQKAVLHLQEAGALSSSPQDIGPLIKEVQTDIQREEKEFITAKLYEWAWPKISRSVVGGLPEWYKEELLKKQFEEAPVDPH